MRIFHVSENDGIDVFHPRPVPSPDAGVTGEAVWAVDEARLGHYLLPRDCPRVCYLGPDGKRVIAVEEGWRERIAQVSLYVYEFDPAAFELVDANAGYYIARASQKPIGIELRPAGEGLTYLENLWDLRDWVLASNFSFSIIRFRNAQPRSS